MNGFENELPGVHSGDAVGDSHKKLLIVLSNIGYCKDELCHGLYDKYKHIWLRYVSNITSSLSKKTLNSLSFGSLKVANSYLII